MTFPSLKTTYGLLCFGLVFVALSLTLTMGAMYFMGNVLIRDATNPIRIELVGDLTLDGDIVLKTESGEFPSIILRTDDTDPPEMEIDADVTNSSP